MSMHVCLCHSSSRTDTASVTSSSNGCSDSLHCQPPSLATHTPSSSHLVYYSAVPISLLSSAPQTTRPLSAAATQGGGGLRPEVWRRDIMGCPPPWSSGSAELTFFLEALHFPYALFTLTWLHFERRPSFGHLSYTLN